MSNLQADLNNFTGTEQYWKLPLFPQFRYTDGVKYLATVAGAYWLLTAIFSYNRKEPFQVWRLVRNTEDKGAVLTMVEDAGQPEKVRQEIEFTDFPLPEIELWLIDGILILKSEY